MRGNFSRVCPSGSVAVHMQEGFRMLDPLRFDVDYDESGETKTDYVDDLQKQDREDREA